MARAQWPSVIPLTRATMCAVALSAVLVACGHPATVEECETIVERIATLEIETRGNIPPDERKDEIERLKQSVRESTMKDCVGNRITDGAMDCVRNAPTSKDVIQCFD